ncbi:hypothetical protein K2224_28880 (plasmid) [Streptomyces sp. BHT-5-2]|uniref:hypothetical protein n=1 Tax=Streptomyces sp. BHT-5-2 TaxID=2866715 RepID=UPI001C8E0082|nr:hypothetical protein [Streptomyces sp. BHT-5-2]QZL07294.1 hypothetical protein K2224_28880 [Streptomyces sp. BHT-5-2]
MALIGSAPAFAFTATTAGSKLTTQSNESHRYARVYDTSADSRSAKGEYNRQASPGETRNLWNSSGSGTVVKSGDGSKIIRGRACRQEQWSPDSCGAWKAN